MAKITPEQLAAHADALRRLALQLLRSPDLAEDAVQDTLTLAWRKQPDVASPGAWLRGALRNVVRNQRRATRRRDQRHAAVEPRIAATPEAIRAREATRRQLLDAVLALPDAHREVVLLRFDQNLPPRKIAMELGIPVHTVHNRLRRGLALMRTSLDEAHGNDGKAWRASLAALIPTLKPSASLAGLVGGFLMANKLLTAAFVVVIGLGVWWVGRDSDTEAAPAETVRSVELVGGPASAAASPSLVTSGGGTGRSTRTPVSRPSVPVIHGHVVRDGVPVPDALVRAFSFAKHAVYEARTDAAGHFELPETRGTTGAHHLRVSHGPSAPFVDRRAIAAAAPREIRLQPGGSIRGAVVDDRGRPVTAYHIRVVHSGYGRGAFDPMQQVVGQALPASCRSDGARRVEDEEGRFRIESLSPGPYALEIVPDGQPPVVRPKQNADRVRVSAGETVDAGELRLPAPGESVVWVLDAETGQVVDDATFEGCLRGHRWPRYPLEIRGRTQGGAYRIPDLRESNRIVSTCYLVTAPGYVPMRGGLSGARPKKHLVIRMQRGGSRSLTVQTDNGSPAVGAVAFVRRESDRTVLWSGTLDDNGQLETSAFPGREELQLFVFDDRIERQLVVRTFEVDRGATTPMRVGGPATTAVRGTVRVQGKPRMQVLVAVNLPGRRGDRRAWTSPDGSFRIEDVPPGPTTIFYNVDERTAMVTRPITIAEGEALDASLDLRHEVSGRVEFVGEPARYMEGGIQLIRSDGMLVEVRLQKDHSFTTWLPEAGTYRVGSESPDFFVEKDVRFTVGEEPLRDQRIVFARDAGDVEVHIQVVDEETEQPVEGPVATYRSKQTSGWTSRVEAGALISRGHRRGPAAFVIDAPGYVDEKLRVDVKPQPKVIEITVALRRANALRVTKVERDGQGKQLGIRVGDVITHYAGQPMDDVQKLRPAIKRNGRSSAVPLTIVRDGETLTLELRAGPIGIRVTNHRLD